MTLLGVLILLLVALLVGAIAQALVGINRGGCIISVVIGLIGSLIGSFLARTLHAPSLLVLGGIDIVWGIIGAVLFLVLLRLFLRLA